MNAITRSAPALPGLHFPKFEPTADERERIDAAAAELAGIDERLAQVVDLRAHLANAADDFAAGKMGLVEAIAALSSANDASARHELANTLRKPLKLRARAVLQEVHDILERKREAECAWLCERCAKLEQTERAEARELGIPADDFEPSPTLARLRESHRRHRESTLTGDRREAFRRLVEGSVEEVPQATPPKKKAKAAPEAIEDDTDLSADFH